MPILHYSAALSKARNWCARQERSHSETRSKLFSWGLKPKEVESIIAELITGGFINEERFARQYAGGKFRMKKWGKLKIQHYLKQKNITEYCIHSGLQEIGERDYRKTLEMLATKKAGSLKEKNPLIKKNKIARYLVAKGYEPALVWEVLENVKVV